MSTFADDSDIPVEFLCPITQQLMVYPFTTAEGNSYEYSAISLWLRRHDVDPLTNLPLSDTRLFPNNSLRSSIQAWLESHPAQAAEVRGRRLDKPPRAAYEVAVANANATTTAYHGGGADVALSRVLRVHKSFELGGAGAKDATTSGISGDGKATVRVLRLQRQRSITAFGHTYTWDADGEHVRCDDGPWVEAPEPDLFVTPLGVAFFDATELREARVLPDTHLAEPCKYANGCTKADCVYAHPFVCGFGTMCRHASAGRGPERRCKFLHPTVDSVVPIGPDYPLNQECRYKTSCSNRTCQFAHPRGCMTVPRSMARVFATHSPTLEELKAPVELPATMPEACTTYQLQGEFLLCFEPFVGPWAKQHFRRVTVLRFDARVGARHYRPVGTYELERHYCNCAVAAGRYLVLSFWPYEEEAMRTVWECLRIGRTMEKALRSNADEIEAMRGEVASLQAALRDKEQQLQAVQRELAQERGESERLRHLLEQLQYGLHQAQRAIASRNAVIAQRTSQLRMQHVAHQRQVRDLRGQMNMARSKAAVARREARSQRMQVQALERQGRAMQQNYERQRLERLRLRDPIHVYALQGGRDGFDRDDWALVLDYHKGAHELSLSAPARSTDGGRTTSQLLEVVEHSTVVQFELHVPRNVADIGAPLPLQPGRLCEEF